MIVFLDENIPPALLKHMKHMYRDHEYMRVGVQTPKGMDDIDLFRALFDKRVNVFITSDVKQLHRPAERKACRDAGIHWVGVPKNPKARGPSAKRSEIAAVLANFTHIERHISRATSPQAFLMTFAAAEIQCQDSYPQPL